MIAAEARDSTHVTVVTVTMEAVPASSECASRNLEHAAGFGQLWKSGFAIMSCSDAHSCR